MRTSFRGIRQLEYFLTICEAGSFTRAAERLYVSQPAVTNAIRSLEEELGIQLFDRSQKLATLTAEGRIFAGHVEKIMHGITRTVEEIHSLRNLTSGVLDIGLTALGGQFAIISLLKAYRHAYPDIQMILHEDTTGNLQQALIEEKLDLAIFAPWQKNNSLSYEMLDEEELVVCCSRHHALHRRNSVALADLKVIPGRRTASVASASRFLAALAHFYQRELQQEKLPITTSAAKQSLASQTDQLTRQLQQASLEIIKQQINGPADKENIATPANLPKEGAPSPSMSEALKNLNYLVRRIERLAAAK